MDTSVLQFYPTLFVLATDVLDMLGDMVWKRIQQKAEFSEDGTFLCSLPGLNLLFSLDLFVSVTHAFSLDNDNHVAGFSSCLVLDILSLCA